jgi:alpha-D-xyloside xylohydrolase
VIPLRWNDRSSAVTIGARQGTFPGMVEHRKFRVVLVGSSRGAGGDVTSTPNLEVEYDGNEVQKTIK